MNFNFREYTQLTINGNTLEGFPIIDYCRKSKIENIRALGKFMQEWLCDSSTINVQTSGSTGIPKVIEVKKEQMLASADATARFFDFKEGQTALLCLPVNYIAGKMMIVRALLSNLNLICIQPDSNPLAHISRPIDFVPLTPMQLAKAENTTLIKKILLGGGPVTDEMENKFQQFSSEIFHGYGMTETLSHIALRRISDTGHAAIYQALPGVSFELDDRNCLVIHVPFLQQPVITNDIAELKDNRAFIWKGREDNVINSGGIKFFPEEIEKKLAAFITKKFFVFGLPDQSLGTQLCLLIEGEQPAESYIKKLQENVSLHLQKYEQPKQLFFYKNFILTASGKLRREATLSAAGFVR